jgi:hypothetical protein
LADAVLFRIKPRASEPEAGKFERIPADELGAKAEELTDLINLVVAFAVVCLEQPAMRAESDDGSWRGLTEPVRLSDLLEKHEGRVRSRASEDASRTPTRSCARPYPSALNITRTTGPRGRSARAGPQLPGTKALSSASSYCSATCLAASHSASIHPMRANRSAAATRSARRMQSAWSRTFDESVPTETVVNLVPAPAGALGRSSAHVSPHQVTCVTAESRFQRVVAVQPKAAFLAYFEAQSALGAHPGYAGVGTKRERRGSNPRCTHPTEATDSVGLFFPGNDTLSAAATQLFIPPTEKLRLTEAFQGYAAADVDAFNLVPLPAGGTGDIDSEPPELNIQAQATQPIPSGVEVKVGPYFSVNLNASERTLLVGVVGTLTLGSIVLLNVRGAGATYVRILNVLRKSGASDVQDDPQHITVELPSGLEISGGLTSIDLSATVGGLQTVEAEWVRENAQLFSRLSDEERARLAAHVSTRP